MVTAVVLTSRDRPDFATLPIGLDSASLYLCLSVSLSLPVFLKFRVLLIKILSFNVAIKEAQ